MSSNPMRNVPAVAIAPPALCFYRLDSTMKYFCSKHAAVMRAGKTWFDHQFFCALHQAPGDIPIPAERAFRRVRLTVDVYVSGTSVNAPIAHATALARLEDLARLMGAVLDVHDVRSDWVKSTAGAPDPTTLPHTGVGE